MKTSMMTATMILFLALPRANAAEEKSFHDMPQGATLVLPKTPGISTGWVIVPGMLKDLHDKKLSFNVAPNGKILLASNRILFYPENMLTLTTKVPIQEFIWLAGGNMFVHSAQSLGFLNMDEDKLNGKPGASKDPGLVAFSSRFTLPYKQSRLFEGSGDFFYVVGRNEKENRNEISAWNLADAKVPAKPLYATDAPISAVVGTPDRTYFATGRAVFVLEKGATSAKPVYVNPREDIRELAYRPEAGLFFTTGNSAGYIGEKEQFEFLAYPDVQLRLRGDALFVRLGTAANGVLRISGAKHFAEIQLDPQKSKK
jgi:hypothetical protein